jgi:hypothetical protein
LVERALSFYGRFAGIGTTSAAHRRSGPSKSAECVYRNGIRRFGAIAQSSNCRI